MKKVDVKHGGKRRGAGRKFGTDGINKDKNIIVSVDASEKQAVKDASTDNDMSVSDYLRALIFKGGKGKK